MNMKKLSVITFFLFCGCQSQNLDIIQAGPFFEPRPQKEVEIFNDRNKIKKPFGAIAVIHSEKYRCSEKNSEKYVNKAVKEAAKIGADAIVYAIGEDAVELNPGLPPECYLSGMAVKYVSESSKK